MTPLIEIAILAVVQGVAEFLPISSSGHLVVVAAVFDQFGVPVTEKLTVNIVLHVGTLAAILVYYRRRLLDLLVRDHRVVGLLVAGTVPAAVVGPILKAIGGDVLESPLLAGAALIVTGAMLLFTLRVEPGALTAAELSYPRAFAVGMFQAFAILPGISRSGATIVAGLGCGLRRDEAAAFSFLLAIPAIGGAGVLESIDLAQRGVNSTPIAHLAIGAGLSFVVGLASLAWLIRWLQKGKLHYFAWWVLLVGPCVILWRLFFP